MLRDNLRIFFTLCEIYDNSGVQDTRAARAHSVPHLNAGRDEGHAGGIDAGAAHAAINLKEA